MSSLWALMASNPKDLDDVVKREHVSCQNKQVAKNDNACYHSVGL